MMQCSPRMAAVASVVALVVACSGTETPGPAAVEAARAEEAPVELVARTWQVRMADATVRAPYEQHAGWAKLYNRAYDEAIAAFAAAPGDGRGLARMHTAQAALYRQAALLNIEATLQVYGADRQDSDPTEVAYLVGAASALKGDLERARLELGTLGTDVDPAIAERAGRWVAWLNDGGTWPPDEHLVGFPGPGEEPTPGLLPSVGDLPHYRLAERTEAGLAVEAGDPTSLYLLSRWHEAAAVKAAPQDEAVVRLVLAPWALPLEPSPTSELVPISDDWLFAGFYTCAEDVMFLAAAVGQGGGIEAVKSWSDRSPLAAVMAPAIQDGKVMPDQMLDQAAGFAQVVQAAMEKTAGREEAIHRPFAELARLGALRAAMFVAESTGESRDAGVLRINALDRSSGPGADPVFFMSISAWSASTRSPVRAQDLVHGLLTRFPAVQAARYPLDAMQVRISRNSAPATPVH